MSQYRHRPRPLNLRPEQLDNRLREYAQSIEAANSPASVGFVDTARDLPVRGDWFRIVEEREEDIRCTRADTGVTYYVSKPPDLRGFIATRTEGSSVFEITPPYTAAGIVYGESFPGGHGHRDATTNEQYEWFDQNVNGRQWARVPT